MSLSCPPTGANVCYQCGANHYASTVNAASHGSLSRVTTTAFEVILGFVPASALDMRMVSHRCRQNTDAFLFFYRRVIVQYCSSTLSPLSLRILRSFGRLGASPLQFHLSIPKSIRALTMEECPDGVLSLKEIRLLELMIEEGNLRRVWGKIHERISAAHPVPAGLLALDASAEKIRAWMRAEENKPLVEGITWLHLDRRDLSCIPQEIALCTALQNLYLYDNELVLGLQELLPLKAMRMLYLTSNQLAFIPQGLFQGLPALEELFLAENGIATLPDETFQGLTALRKLSLSGNPLIHVSQNLFQGLTGLRELYLCRNRLTTLPVGIFQDLIALERLFLADTRLGFLPEGIFQNMTSLQLLYLQENGLVHISQGLFQGLTALQVLDLSSNQITFVPAGVFQGLTALQVLDLSSNQITSVPDGVFRDLTVLQQLRLDRIVMDCVVPGSQFLNHSGYNG